MDTCQIMKLKDLYYSDFEIVNIYAMRQKWAKNMTFYRSQGRPRTGLTFLNKCIGIYTDQSGEEFTAMEKSIVCLPYGSKYTCLNAECSNTLDDAIQVEFNVVIDGAVFTFSDKPFLVKDMNTPLISKLFNDVIQAYEAALPANLAIKTAIYNLLLYICKEKIHKYHKRFSAIAKGIELLEADPLCKTSIEEIAKTCNVSTSYFRRLFKEYSGKSPCDYRIDLRMNMAKELLESGETTLDYIADSLNFENTSYFCRIFKNKFGITPSQYKISKFSEDISNHK